MRATPGDGTVLTFARDFRIGHIPKTVGIKAEWLKVSDIAAPTTAEINTALSNTGLGTEIIPDETATFYTFMVAKVTIYPISLVQPLTRSPFLTQVNAWNLVSVRDALSGLENRVAPLLHCLRSQKTSQDEVVEVLVSVDLTIWTLQ